MNINRIIIRLRQCLGRHVKKANRESSQFPMYLKLNFLFYFDLNDPEMEAILFSGCPIRLKACVVCSCDDDVEAYE